MSVTDELRELLDEMGVTWRPCGPLVTKWQQGGWEYAARETNGELYVSIPQMPMTPRQAIDVTLNNWIERCKDCEYAMYDGRYCRYFTDDEDPVAVEPDGFCAWGERWCG